MPHPSPHPRLGSVVCPAPPPVCHPSGIQYTPLTGGNCGGGLTCWMGCRPRRSVASPGRGGGGVLSTAVPGAAPLEPGGGRRWVETRRALLQAEGASQQPGRASGWECLARLSCCVGTRPRHTGGNGPRKRPPDGEKWGERVDGERGWRWDRGSGLPHAHNQKSRRSCHSDDDIQTPVGRKRALVFVYYPPCRLSSCPPITHIDLEGRPSSHSLSWKGGLNKVVQWGGAGNPRTHTVKWVSVCWDHTQASTTAQV